MKGRLFPSQTLSLHHQVPPVCQPSFSLSKVLHTSTMPTCVQILSSYLDINIHVPNHHHHHLLCLLTADLSLSLSTSTLGCPGLPLPIMINRLHFIDSTKLQRLLQVLTQTGKRVCKGVFRIIMLSVSNTVGSNLLRLPSMFLLRVHLWHRWQEQLAAMNHWLQSVDL